MTEQLNPVHILIAEDEAQLRSVLRLGLEAAGYTVSEAGSKAALLERLDRQPPIDLITLDLTLSDGDGLGLAREIRSRLNVPVIVITARAGPDDRVSGLEHGADDYIVKPFHIREVLIRIETVLRSYAKPEVPSDTGGSPERYGCTAGVLDVQRRELMAADGKPIALTDVEFDILLIFVRNPGRVMSRDDIMVQLKGRRWSPTDRTVDGHIARLRRKIEPDIEAPRLLKTVWRVGYVFADDVERLS